MTSLSLILAAIAAPGRLLKALYADDERHSIHNDVSMPSPGTAAFVSRVSASEMSSQFQIQLPGQKDWRPYPEWSGARK